MEWTISSGRLLAAPVDAVVTPVAEGDDIGPVARALDGALGGALARLLADTAFRGKDGSVRTVYTFGLAPVRFLTLVGLGAEGSDAAERVRVRAARAARSAREAGATSMALGLPEDLAVEEAARVTAEGILLAMYRNDHYKSDSVSDKRLTDVHLIVSPGQEEAARRGVAAAEAIAAGVALARDLVNQTGADLWPDRLAQRTAAMAAEAGMACQIYGGEELATMGAGALLAVGHGSDRPPRLVHLRYRPGAPSDAPVLTYVGKGITFDTGGYNLKPGASMDTMKCDMGGAAAVIGALQTIARLKLPIAVDGVIVTAENMVSGRAMRPGDVLTAMNGTTIEVNNTDAEGRLVLADAMIFALRNGAREIIDLATLTGACVVALGAICTGVMGNQQAMVDRVLAAAGRASERMWQLPLYDEYREALRSEVADMRNSGGRNAGAQVGAIFIREFVGDTPWVHLDIAGTAWADKETPLSARGGTGVGVRTLVALAETSAAG